MRQKTLNAKKAISARLQNGYMGEKTRGSMALQHLQLNAWGDQERQRIQRGHQRGKAENFFPVPATENFPHKGEHNASCLS